MDIKLFFTVIIFGSCTALSMNAINLLPYKTPTLYLIIQIVSGPISALVLLDKKYWLRAFIAIAAFTGLAGIINVTLDMSGLLLFNATLTHPLSAYLYHGALSLIFLFSFIAWYYLVGRSENNNVCVQNRGRFQSIDATDFINNR